MTDQREKLRTWGICAALAISVMTLFWGALDCDFINFDDPLYVTSNREIQHGLNARSVAWAFSTGTLGNWNPLTWFSHIMDVQFYGMKPAGHHLTNLLLHAASSVLLFLILKRMTGAMWRSALVAALFALHPLRVESVVWISERKDVLSTFFWMLTVLAYIRYTEELKAGNGRPKLFYTLSAAFFALSLMAKPMVVTLPCVLLLLDYWPLERIRKELTAKNAENTEKVELPNTDSSQSLCSLRSLRLNISSGCFRNLFIEKLPFFALAIALSVVTLVMQRKGGAVATVGDLSIGARICNAFISYVRYLGKAVWPVNLGVMYPHPGHWPAWQVIAAVMFLALVSWLVLRRLAAQPYLAVGWCWYLGTLAPVSGIMQAGLQSMADRFTYVPLVGVFIMVVWGVCEWTECHPLGRRIAVVCGILAMGGCIVLTPRQVRFWRNSESLFTHTAEVTDKNHMAYDMIGVALYGKRQTAEAMKYFQKSLEIKPYYEEALNNYGFGLASMGRYQEAIRDFEMALKVKPSMIAAHNNLANALLNTGRLDEAMSECRKALDLDPHFGKAHDNYGTALAKNGKTVEAIAQFREAIRDNPDDYTAHCNLGNALAEQGKPDDAIAEYHICLRINPKFSECRDNLANILLQQGKLDEAMAELQKVVELTPGNADIRIDLGTVLLEKGEFNEAISQFQKAIDIRPDAVPVRKKLADIFLEKGRVEEAISQFQKIAELTPNDPLVRGKLGDLLLQKGNVDAAVAEFQKVVELAPDNPHARYNLGDALLQKGDVAGAAAQYQKAVDLAPAYVTTHDEIQNNLAYIAWALSTSPDASIRNGAKAIEIARRTDQLSGGANAMVLGALAAGYAETGQFTNAVATVQRALQQAGNQNNTEMVNTLQKQLKSYQEGSPFREAAQP